MSLTAGTHVGAFEILAPIGAGGMGEVYRARDTRLNRDVAVKVLPDTFATDAERVARFRREAQLLATLNHPNIGHIYGFEDHPSAIVLELVEGPTLADRIGGGVPSDRRRAAHRETDRRRARSRARTRHHSPRSQTRQHQDQRRRHGEGARFRTGEGVRSDGSVDPHPAGFEVVSVTTQPSFGFGTPVAIPRPFVLGAPIARRSYDVMPDGRFVGLVREAQGDLYGPTTQQFTVQFTVVLNWDEELKRRVR